MKRRELAVLFMFDVLIFTMVYRVRVLLAGWFSKNRWNYSVNLPLATSNLPYFYVLFVFRWTGKTKGKAYHTSTPVPCVNFNSLFF